MTGRGRAASGPRRVIVTMAALVLGVGCAAAVAGAHAGGAPARHRVCHWVGHGRHRHRICHPAHHRAPARAPTSTTTVSSPAPPPAVAGVPASPGPSGVTSTPTTPVPALPSRVGVEEYEYSVVAGHSRVAAGSVELNVSDIGQDDHNLTISENGVLIAQTPVLHPGDPATAITADLGPGTYKLYCSLYNHDQLGMHATLVVQ